VRPHRLRVTAFGAFGGTVSVSFDDLASAGLFLLHGETGAGKTTLLDAVGFALYGRVPGERGKARRLRSDHALADVATEVELEATIGGRRLVITRRPEQRRRKLRGEGFTVEQARVVLSEVGVAEPVSTRVGEADTEIADLMGMSAEQFFQVVLLPQGEFARFLQSDAEGRGKLLQKLFGTDRFRDVEEWLARRRVTMARELDEARQGIDQLAARIAGVAGVDLPAVMAVRTTTSTDISPDWAARLGEDAAREADGAELRVESCRISLDAARERQHQAERLTGFQRRRADATRRQQELVAVEPRIAALRLELEAARRAAEVAGTLAAASHAAAAAEQARTAEQRARAACGAWCAASDGASDGDGDGVAVGVAELRNSAQQHLQKQGHLEALRSLADQAAGEDVLSATARKHATDHYAEAVGLKERLVRQQRPRRDELTATREAAHQAALRLPAARSEADRHRRAADAVAALSDERKETDRAAAEHLAARETAVALREDAARLREARIDGMRAELAATLTDGAPCPVCGSLDHPELCELRDEQVTRAQEAAATAAAEAAIAAAEQVGKKLATAQARVADLTARLAGEGFEPQAQDLNGLDVTARELDAGAARMARTASALDSVQADLDELVQAIADAETRLAELGQLYAAELEKAVAAEGRAAGHRDELTRQLGEAADLDAALADARAAADALTAAADAADTTARAAEAARQAQDAALRAAAGAGFADLTAAREAGRDEAWRTRADTSVREYEASAAAVATQLADPDLDVPLDPPADLRGAAQAAAVASEEHAAAVAAQARAQRAASQLAVLVPSLTLGLAELAPLHERAAEARALADLAAGQGANMLKMTLSSFVLAARLEEVAAAASQRLLRMTAGRYSLVHSDARRGGARSGLGLLACDAWTGVDRDTSTLSGGETFMASLALALGLADVVTEEAGGTRIEALFVDEGFGSLDEDTLEEVMNVLDGLREGGRCVGIVSHVAELRQRIPAQLRVRKTPSGSSVAVS
jgi:DNA repair protein SbcC/Rad50